MYPLSFSLKKDEKEIMKSKFFIMLEYAMIQVQDDYAISRAPTKLKYPCCINNYI